MSSSVKQMFISLMAALQHCNYRDTINKAFKKSHLRLLNLIFLFSFESRRIILLWQATYDPKTFPFPPFMQPAFSTGWRCTIARHVNRQPHSFCPIAPHQSCYSAFQDAEGRQYLCKLDGIKKRPTGYGGLLPARLPALPAPGSRY